MKKINRAAAARAKGNTLAEKESRKQHALKLNPSESQVPGMGSFANWSALPFRIHHRCWKPSAWSFLLPRDGKHLMHKPSPVRHGFFRFPESILQSLSLQSAN